LRLSARLGFSRHDTPDEVEADLRQLLPQETWFIAHQLLIWHGRRVCDAKKPACAACTVAALCPKKGVTR
jgi:endonuclease-3